MDQDRRRAFDSIAAQYAAHRPGPPDAVYDAIAELAVPPPARLLEIACGPGTVTLPLARRGYRIHAVELGAKLAAIARERLAGFPFTIEVGPFEEAKLERAAFDLCVCASAFHWLDRPRAYAQIAHALRPGGAVAIFWSAVDRRSPQAGAFEWFDDLYQREAPELAGGGRGAARPKEVRETVTAELVATGNFDAPVVRRIVSRRAYDASGYLALLGTYSDHVLLPPERREALFRAIAERIDTRLGGRVEITFANDLQVARRR